MTSTKDFRSFGELLKQELIPALGCTEPIAIALACAMAREILAEEPEQIKLYCSGNVIKNVKSVLVPNSGGRQGITIAAALGVVVGEASRKLRILDGVTKEQQEEAVALARSGRIQTELAECRESLYILVEMKSTDQTASAELNGNHTEFTRLMKNGVVTYQAENNESETAVSMEGLNIKNILTYAAELEQEKNEEISAVLRRQIAFNKAIAEEGLKGKYGAQVGKTILETEDREKPETLAKAWAAAGSDARMSGCDLPVVINSGSGNQGLTVSLPVIIYGEYLETDETRLMSALAVANLVAIHQKSYIGKLSAFCGAVSAAAGAGAGIGWLLKLDYEQISGIITNITAATGGMLCDGAKPSCALKIAVALNNVFLAVEMSKRGRVLSSGCGLVGRNVEETIQNVGYIARTGLREADKEILDLMLRSEAVCSREQ